jgi:3-methyladenine DNA glycosylase AlkD
MPLYERLIREGAWWDLVDDAAIRLAGRVLRAHRQEMSDVMDAWIDDDDLWIRRSALISQIGHRAETDHGRLFDYCRKRAGESEFFIRKAIGWALRDYSYAAPERVMAFLTDNRQRLSGLSFREGAKALRRKGHKID